MDIYKAAKDAGIDVDAIGRSPKRARTTPEENSANMQNANEGTPGTNRQYDKVHGNRGKQLNPNQKQPAAVPIDEDLDQGDVYYVSGSD